MICTFQIDFIHMVMKERQVHKSDLRSLWFLLDGMTRRWNRAHEIDLTGGRKYVCLLFALRSAILSDPTTET